MDAITVMRGQLKQAHEILEQAVGDLDSDALHRRLPGSTVHSIAAIYAHTVIGEDMLLNGVVRGGAPLYQTGGWSEKIGIDPGSGRLSDDWSDAVRIEDLPTLQEYAQGVYQQSDAYLGSLSEGDLVTMTNSPLGEMPLGAFLGNIIVWHAISHGGEVCALKGCMGGKGLPF
jgi:hypothetical protein